MGHAVALGEPEATAYETASLAEVETDSLFCGCSHLNHKLAPRGGSLLPRLGIQGLRV